MHVTNRLDFQVSYQLRARCVTAIRLECNRRKVPHQPCGINVIGSKNKYQKTNQSETDSQQTDNHNTGNQALQCWKTALLLTDIIRRGR